MPHNAVKFTVIQRWDHTIVVQWVENFGSTGSPFHRALIDALEPIHGIERVGIGRYSVLIEPALHVLAAGGIDIDDFADAIADSLEDPMLLYYIRRTLNNDDATIHVEVQEA